MVALISFDNGRDTCLIREIKHRCGKGRIKRYLPNEPVFPALKSRTLVLRVKASNSGEFALPLIDVISVTSEDPLDAVYLGQRYLRLKGNDLDFDGFGNEGKTILWYSLVEGTNLRGRDLYPLGNLLLHGTYNLLVTHLCSLLLPYLR